MKVFTALLLSTIDEETRLKTLAMQSQAMHLFLIRGDATGRVREEMLNDLTKGAVSAVDKPCDWRGVRCTHDAVTSFQLTSDTSGFSWIVSMDWLPSTLRELYLARIPMRSGWSAERLPRDMRYMQLVHCSARFGHESTINLHALPDRMEELVVREGWYSGEVHVQHLPETMRILYLQHRWFKHAVIDEESLPGKLIHLRVTTPDKGVSFVNTEGKPVRDLRVSDQFDLADVLRSSRYAAKYEGK